MLSVPQQQCCHLTQKFCKPLLHCCLAMTADTQCLCCSIIWTDLLSMSAIATNTPEWQLVDSLRLVTQNSCGSSENNNSAAWM